MPDLSIPSQHLAEISVWRQPPGTEQGGFETHFINLIPGDHILNLLWRIRREVDPTLAFPDHYCKVGTCGACALQVNSRSALGCRTLVRERLLIAPAKGRRVIADLLTEPSSTMEAP